MLKGDSIVKNFLHYNILISCPSDIAKDKYIVDEAVKKINEENASFNNIQFDVKYWNENVLYSYGTPQQIINKNIVYESDIVIALFGTKLGTPTDKYESGTIEEIEIMIKNEKQVFVCFSEKDIMLTSDADEEYLKNIIKVKQFKKTYNGLYITYKNGNQLKENIENQLRLYLNKINNEASKNEIGCDSSVISTLNSRANNNVEKELREMKQLIWRLIDEFPRDNNIIRKAKVKRNRILWVDDYPINNESVVNLFEDKDIQFDIALTTKQGLELYKNELYDLIITDMGRGDESDAGLSLLKELKLLHCKTPIIVYASRRAIERYGEESLRLGAYKVTNGIGNIISVISDILEL